MEPRIQYAKTTDGVNIAFATAGEGRTVIVVPTPPLSHVQRQWDLLPGQFRGLVERFRAVWYDSRGSGLSDRTALDFTLPAMVRDLESVADRAGGDTFALWAVYDGVSIAIAYAVTHPSRVSHLILADGWASFSDYYEAPTILAEEALRSQDWLIYTETFARVLSGLEGPESAAFAAEYAKHIRACVEPDALKAAYSAQGNESWDVVELLGQVQTPTLILHNRGNRFLSTQVGQRLAAAIPDARFMLIDDMVYNDAPRLIEGFIRDTTYDELGVWPLASGTAIILFADIVDSTALTERLGDAAFRAKARDLDAALRSVIREHSGTPIEGKLLGDGVLAVFTSGRQAIEAALACGQAGNHAGLPLHLGLHAGDVIREDNNVYGGAVNIASRISGVSAPGEVLVSETVRSLARTSAGVRFEDRGEQALKGVGEPVRVWAVVIEPPAQ
jgi:class 3 adenylate cyclase